ncbi:hypothetical protein [Kluyvera chengduensis]|uniref:hypothetical protein n=1 Tax=Kluyvera sp. 142359 TaxID=3375726 RepID=UPI0037724125
MQFSDLTKMVQDIWSFSWPPLAICIIAFFMARFFHPIGTIYAFRATVARAKKYGMALESARTILEPYGLTKLVPTISIVVVISVMFLLNGPVTSLVSDLPPHISFQPDLLLSDFMSQSQKLALIRQYPMTRSLGEAYYLALESVRLESKNEPSYNLPEIWYQVHELLKFAFVFAIIMFFISLRAGLPIGRLLVKLISVSFFVVYLWCLSLTALLYEQQQQLYLESRPVVLSLEKNASTLMFLPMTTKEEEKLTPGLHERGLTWWNIYLYDKHRMQWLQKTFLPSKFDKPD